MGVVDNISHDRFPRQSEHIGKRVTVTFHYDFVRSISGTIVRDDIEEPYEMIISLDDGRFVRSKECQYR